MTNLASALSTPSVFVQAYLHANNIQITNKGDLNSSQFKTTSSILSQMHEDLRTQVAAYNSSQASLPKDERSGKVALLHERYLQAAVDRFVEKAVEKQMVEFSDSIKCEEEDLSHLRVFMEAVMGKLDKVDVSVFAHFLWQVKMKVNQKNPTDHVMPVLFGRQGCGKTQALNKLFHMFSSYRTDFDMTDLSDSRCYKQMAHSFVCVFDEMQGAARADVNSLKAKITANTVSYRPLGSNDNITVRQNCSFIAASNITIAEQIIDPTGMRRFWEVNCAETMDWEALNNIDYLALWKGIDENKLGGYYNEYPEEVKARQAGLIAQDDVTSFMQAVGLDPVKKSVNEGKWISSASLYFAYDMYCKDNGIKPKTSIVLGRALVGKGFMKKVVKQDKTATNCYLVTKDFCFTSTYVSTSFEGGSV